MKLFSVVVLYKCKLDESSTLNSLLKIHKNNPQSLSQVDILIYDNGPIIQSLNESHPENFRYLGTEDNAGLAVAYNWALDLAAQGGGDWLLLLDQDTELPIDYFSDLTAALEKQHINERVKAAVPEMYSDGKFFSPCRVLYGGLLRPINKHDPGIYGKEIYANGSGSVLRVDFFLEIGGFSKEFWLDSLDRWIYHAIHQAKGDVLVLDIKLEHQLSAMDYDKYVSEERYRYVLKYEALFLRKYKSTLENIVYYLRLLLRVVRYYFTKSNKQYSKITFNHLTGLIKNRIFPGRSAE
ncbi:MAG: glycosyltransferase [Gammaproteobacteria bacterium]|nr:glycosyltransferase [Gammaproteobacteria bacterium]